MQKLSSYIDILEKRNSMRPTIEHVIDTLVSCTALVACAAQKDERHVQKELKKRLESVTYSVSESKERLDSVYNGEVFSSYHENNVMQNFDLQAMIEVAADVDTFDSIDDQYDYMIDLVVSAAGPWCQTTKTPRSAKERIAKTVAMMMNQMNALPMFSDELEVIVPVLTKSNSAKFKAEAEKLKL